MTEQTPLTEAGRLVHQHIDEEETPGAPNLTEHSHVGGDKWHHHENDPRRGIGLDVLGRLYRRGAYREDSDD